ncbi:MAG: magnesium transporter [Puniceicoccales bacterium]|jgi:magnesium transporter|nr:magnesium transporter [Puniceicoccales bacterium]
MSSSKNIEDRKTSPRHYTFEELQDCVENDFKNLNAIKLARTPPHEIGAWLERLSQEEREIVLRKLSVDDVTEVLAEMNVSDSAEIISEMRDAKAIKILSSLAPDDAADLLGELEDDVRERLMAKMPSQVAATLRNLLTYDPNTAGGVMTPHVAALKVDMTVDEAIEFLRENKDVAENVESLYVTDNKKHLVGVLNVQKLLWTDPHAKIGDLMCHEVEGICSLEQDKETVAHMMAKNHFNTLPVVDGQHRLIGIVTHDDVIDILREEATEDIQKLHGAGGDESIHDSVPYSIFRRTPWLVINLCIAFVTASVIRIFEQRIAQCTVLAVFMVMITGLSGNSGAQTLAIAIRGLALGEYHSGDSLTVVLRETLKGFLNGIIIGFIALIVTGIWSQNIKVGVVVFLAMILNMGLSGFVGSLIPIFLTRIKCDPAQSSYIFLTSVTDIAGMFIFLGIGSYFLL